MNSEKPEQGVENPRLKALHNLCVDIAKEKADTRKQVIAKVREGLKMKIDEWEDSRNPDSETEIVRWEDIESVLSEAEKEGKENEQSL